MGYAGRQEHKARRIGREHGAAGTAPLANFGEDDSALMSALGETAPTTEANAPRRWRLLRAYWEAYDRGAADARERAGC